MRTAVESIDAFEQAKRSGKLSQLQSETLRMVHQYPGHTSREYGEMYQKVYTNKKRLPTSIQPRLSELELDGWIERSGRRRCSLSNKVCGTFQPAKKVQKELFGEEA